MRWLRVADAIVRIFPAEFFARINDAFALFVAR